MRNKARVDIDKAIKVIMVFLLIALVLVAIFLADILSWIRTLPWFSSGTQPEESTEEEVTPASEVQTLCPIRVGGISPGKVIFFCPNFDLNCEGRVYSKLIWSGDNANADINVYQVFVFDWMNKDENIGRVRAKVIYIPQDILEGKEQIYESVRENLPEQNFLKNLNGSYYITGNLICRKEILR